MNWAHFAAGETTADAFTPTPTDRLVLEETGWRDATEAELAERGWYPVTPVVKPPDTATTRYVHSVQMVSGVATEVWAPVALTPEEQTLVARKAARKAVEASLSADPETHVATLLQAVVTLQQIKARTNADINANPAAAIKDVVDVLLTVARRQVRLFRLVGRVFDSTNTG